MLGQVLKNAVHWPLDAVAELQWLLEGNTSPALIVATAVPFVSGALAAFVLFPVDDTAMKFIIFVSAAALANQPQLFSWIDKEVAPPPPKPQRIPRVELFQQRVPRPPYPFNG
jgi:hypothetical protein